MFILVLDANIKTFMSHITPSNMPLGLRFLKLHLNKANYQKWSLFIYVEYRFRQLHLKFKVSVTNFPLQFFSLSFVIFYGDLYGIDAPLRMQSLDALTLWYHKRAILLCTIQLAHSSVADFPHVILAFFILEEIKKNKQPNVWRGIHDRLHVSCC